MIPAKHFYMIRHGETEANAAQIMAGWTDSPLTELGRQQARNTQAVFKNLEVKPKAIFHSNLSRARETAQIINEVLDLDMYEDEGLAEINAGDMEGKPYEMVRALFDGWPIIPNGEHPQTFFDRIKAAKIKAMNQFDGPVLIVCHGGVMRAFGELYGVSVPGRFKNAHLHDFRPLQENEKKETSQFPWDVYHYDICNISGSVIKEITDIYSGKDYEAA